MSLKRGLLAVLAGLGFVTAAIVLAGRTETPRPSVGLFTTLPITWIESKDIAGYLGADQEPHWARHLLEDRYAVQPLDVLLAPVKPGDGLDGFAYLLLAQPRALARQENVALDAWVNRGGRVLLFADPMLTAHSSFALGDRRRPQDVVLLSPILARWGLLLEFAEDQPGGEHLVLLGNAAIPVDLPGRFRLAPSADSVGTCRLLADGLIADCVIGKGHALILADAALLDREGETPESSPESSPGSRKAALSALLERAFAD